MGCTSMTFIVVRPSQARSVASPLHILTPFCKFTYLLLSLFISICGKNSLNCNHMSPLYVLSSFLPSLLTFFLFSFCLSPFYLHQYLQQLNLVAILALFPLIRTFLTLSLSFLYMGLTTKVLLQMWSTSPREGSHIFGLEY